MYFHFSKHKTKGHLRIRWIKKPETTLTSRRASLPLWVWVCSFAQGEEFKLHHYYVIVYLMIFPNNNHHTEFKTPKHFFFFSFQLARQILCNYVTISKTMKPNFREARLWLHNFAKLSLFADFNISLHSFRLICVRRPLTSFYSSLTWNWTAQTPQQNSASSPIFTPLFASH